MRAAERLFAERGVQSVSLREIAVAAAQRNHSAALYHFGDKRELVECVLERHSTPMQAGWLSALETMDQGGKPEIEQLTELMVRSIVGKLDDPDGGRAYLALCAELISNRAYPLLQMRVSRGPGVLELSRRMSDEVSHLPVPLIVLRMARLAAALYCSLAEYARMLDTGVEVPREALIADLSGSMVALIRQGQPAVEESVAAPRRSRAART